MSLLVPVCHIVRFCHATECRSPARHHCQFDSAIPILCPCEQGSHTFVLLFLC